jgi:two-component system response regulator (stage 0 sporulation protein A)
MIYLSQGGVLLKKRILLVEDDVAHCQEYIEYNNEQGSPHSLSVTHGCSEGLSLVESFQPDVVILDLMLNTSDGSGIKFIKKVRMMNLLKYPWIIVITSISSRDVYDAVLALGIAFFVSKDKADYSPRFVFELIDDFLPTSKRTQCRQNSEEMIKASITEMMDNIGIAPGQDGRAYLIVAIYLALKNNAKSLSRDVYPELMKRYGKSRTAIEQAMRTSIHKAWDTIPMSTLMKHYKPQTSFVSGAPSVKEFIFYFVERLKA